MSPNHRVRRFSRIFAVFDGSRRFAVTAAFVAAAVFLAAGGSALAAPSDLDPTFNGSGFAVAPVRGAATGVVVQSDGRIVAGGGQFDVARFNADGTLDGSFGTGGVAFPQMGNAHAHALVVRPDGKIVVAGDSCYPCAITLARFNSDGSLDSSFGSGGLVSAFGSQDGATALALEDDGKLAVAATVTDQYGDNTLGVALFNADGSVDTSFGAGGLATAGSFYYWEAPTARSVAIESDGKIVVGGTAAAQFVLARFNPDGTLDGSFGSGGIARPAYGYAYAIALQSDGKIIEGGQDPSGFEVELARVNSDGALDSSFGSGGTATTNFIPNAYYAAAEAIQIQPDGKIVTAGSAYGNITYFALNRFNADGTVDSSFGTGGGVLTAFPGMIDQGAHALALQADGRIVAAGDAYPSTSGSQFVVARYLGDPLVTPVKIDVKPGDFPNVIDLGSKGTIPVAVLSTADFNAPKQVNTASLKFGRAGNESSLTSCSPPQDVNKDGLLDVLCHFSALKTGFHLGDTQGVLTGNTGSGGSIRGTDSVVVVSSS
jgi:uncharacterized delta-60 repeat protein